VFGGHGKARRQLVIFVRHFFCGVSSPFLMLYFMCRLIWGIGYGDAGDATPCC
jgi:hypothetical protein